MAPTSGTKQVVNVWLKANGLNATAISPSGDWIRVDVPVVKANELFDADFTVFTNDANGKQTIRTMSYSLPSELQGHVDLIHPTVV